MFRLGWIFGLIVAAVYGGSRLYVRIIPPTAGQTDVMQETAAFVAAAREFHGRIVWSSNRSGNHEITLLDLRGSEPNLAQLTRDARVDTFPRFSPDGSKILFNRSRQEWVSARDPEPWDVWIMNADGSAPRLLAEFGFHPSFTPDGRAVVFARRGKVVRLRFDDRSEEVLLDSKKELAGWGQEPDLFGSRLAITVRGGARRFGIYDLDRRRFAAFPGDGCQIAWWPTGERLVWVEGHQGRGGTRILRGLPDGRGVETLMDLPGPLSHEYFPRVSRDGRWLVWAASAGGHEHDRADYEIFLWRVGTPWNQAMRLTHRSGNDQWPDVYPEG